MAFLKIRVFIKEENNAACSAKFVIAYAVLLENEIITFNNKQTYEV